MGTKLKGDIAEQAAILQALKLGWGVLKPVGDRLPYDLVFDVEGTLVKIQVKSAWFNQARGNYVVDNRRTKTNRRVMIRDTYTAADFDFALVFMGDLDLFYVFPVEVFIGYGSEIHMVEADRRQRKPDSAKYRDAWELILQWAACGETRMRTPVKLGESGSGVTPSQAPIALGLVEKV
ncbi:MAG: endonuclease [Nitrospirae bacterium]|nr:endonuclease [Nitrospirota bacterium]